MRWRFLFGFGIAGAVAGSALGQFAADRVPQTPPGAPGNPSNGPQAPGAPLLPGGLQPSSPAMPGAYTPPVGGLAPQGGGSAPYPTLSSVNQQQQVKHSPLPQVELSYSLDPNHPWALKPEDGAYFICVKSYSRPHKPTAEDNGPSALVLAEMLAKDIRELYKVHAFLYEHISDERRAEAATITAARQQAQRFSELMDERRKQS
jgi:hypothetical protein